MSRLSDTPRRARLGAAVLALLVAAGVMGGWLAWGRGDGAVAQPMPDFATLRLAGTPNRYLVLPPEFAATAKPDGVSPVFDVPVERLEDAALRVIRMQPRVLEVAKDVELRQYAFVQRTPILRFPDTVTIRFVALSDRRSSLAIYSQSRIGHSDLGTNRRRVNRWLAAIREGISG